MSTDPTILTKKNLGILLVSLGIILLVIIGVFLFQRGERTHGLPEMVPSQKTVFYLEFPTELPEDLAKKINETLTINWEMEVLPFAGERAALAFLKNGSSPDLTPNLLIQISETPEAFAAAEKFGKQTATRAKLSFAILSKTLILSSAGEKNEGSIFSPSAQNTPPLASDKHFLTLRRNLPREYFAYTRPADLPASALQWISTKLSRMPALSSVYEAVGADGRWNNGTFIGNSYAIAAPEAILAEAPGQAYRALLLPYLPADFELFLGGNNIPLQMKKADGLNAKNGPSAHMPQISELLALLQKQYFPEKKFWDEIAPALQGEFALLMNGEKFLFITETLPQTEKARALLHSALLALAAEQEPSLREVTLPDGTRALEIMPAKKKAQLKHITISNIEVTEIGEMRDAMTQNKWFIGNDTALLQQSLELTRTPEGAHLRGSELYRRSLQPIMKNPELLGISPLPSGIFSFSKRTYADHMETGFVLE